MREGGRWAARAGQLSTLSGTHWLGQRALSMAGRDVDEPATREDLKKVVVNVTLCLRPC